MGPRTDLGRFLHPQSIDLTSPSANDRSPVKEGNGRYASVRKADDELCDCAVDHSEITQTEKDIQQEVKRREDEEKFFHQNKYKRPPSPNKVAPLYRDHYEAWQYDKYIHQKEDEFNRQYQSGIMKENINQSNDAYH